MNSDPSGNVTLTNVVTGDPYLSVNGSKPVLTKYGTDLASSNTVTLTNASGGAGGTEYVIIPNIVTAALGSGSSGGSGGTLAFTGADLLALIVGGLFLLAMGTLLVVFTRRRAQPSADRLTRLTPRSPSQAHPGVPPTVEPGPAGSVSQPDRMRRDGRYLAARGPPGPPLPVAQ